MIKKMVLTGPPIPIMEYKESETFHVLPAVLNLKHHPLLANVAPYNSNQQQLQHSLWMTSNVNNNNNNNSPTRISLTATRDIVNGEEFFLSYEHHPQSSLMKKNDNNDNNDNSISVFSSIPTMEDYQLVDEIVHEERATFQQKSNILQKKRAAEISTGMRMTAKGIARFHPVVGALLPTRATQLLDYRGGVGSSLNSLKNQTVMNLALHGSCVSDVVALADAAADASSSSASAVTSKAYSKGDIISTLPVYIRRKTTKMTLSNNMASCSEENSNNSANEEVCHSQNSNDDGKVVTVDDDGDGLTCFTRPNIAFEVCPLYSTYSIPTTSDPSDKSISAEVVWAPMMQAERQEVVSKLPHVLWEKYSLHLAWDIVATKDLVSGEKIVVYMGQGDEDPTGKSNLLTNTLVSTKWASSD